MKAVMQSVHDALEARWKKAGSPVHGTEPCLWDMERYIDGLEQNRTPEDVLAEATELLEDWIDCGNPATTEEAAAIRRAKDALVDTA